MELYIERIVQLPSSPIRQIAGLEFVFSERHGKTYHFFLSIWITVLTLMFVCLAIFLTVGDGKLKDSLSIMFLSSESGTTSMNDFSAAFLLFPIGVYWQLDEIFSRKWTYCAGFFNLMVAEKLKDSQNKELDKVRFRYLNATLAVDVIMMKLHTHESFYSSFQDTLKYAVLHAELDLEEFADRLAMRKVRVEEVENLLSEYQTHLNELLNTIPTVTIPKEIICKYSPTEAGSSS